VTIRVDVPDIETVNGGYVRASSPTFLFDADWIPGGADTWESKEFGTLDGWKNDATGSFAYRGIHGRETQVWTGLLAGSPITIELLGSVGEPLASETVTLEPRDRRTVTLRARPAGRFLHGVVVNRKGAPIASAMVGLASASGDFAQFVSSGPDGQFSFSKIFTERVRVVVEADGYVAFEGLVETQGSSEGTPVRIIIEEARVVRALATDTQGKEIPIDGIRAEREGAPAIRGGLGGDAWLVKNVPETNVTIVIVAAGREWRREIDAREPVARFVLPVVGSVAIQVAKKAPEGGAVGATLQAEGVESKLLPVERDASPDRLTFPIVAPGRYELRVRIAAMPERTVDPQDLIDTKKTIEVRSGETTTVTFDGALR
jgi:hypothetical protein